MTGSIPCRMQHPSVPCLNVGTPRKLIWLPAEICHICAGQRRLKLDERQVIGHSLCLHTRALSHAVHLEAAELTEYMHMASE